MANEQVKSCIGNFTALGASGANLTTAFRIAFLFFERGIEVDPDALPSGPAQSCVVTLFRVLAIAFNAVSWGLGFLGFTGGLLV